MNRKQCRPYKNYDNTQHATIGKYACQNGPVTAARRFSKTLENPVSENTFKSIKDAKIEEI